jgi:hypothetical protein
MRFFMKKVILMLAVLGLVVARGQSEPEAKVSEFAKKVRDRIPAEARREIPDLALKGKRLERLDTELQAADEGKKTPAIKTQCDVVSYELTLKEERANLNVSIFNSNEDASIIYERMVNMFPVGPLIEIPGLGDAGARVAGKDDESTGSLLFRRERVYVHINSPKAALSIQLAHILDRILQEELKLQKKPL